MRTSGYQHTETERDPLGPVKTGTELDQVCLRQSEWDQLLGPPPYMSDFGGFSDYI